MEKRKITNWGHADVIVTVFKSNGHSVQKLVGCSMIYASFPFI